MEFYFQNVCKVSVRYAVNNYCYFFVKMHIINNFSCTSVYRFHSARCHIKQFYFISYCEFYSSLTFVFVPHNDQGAQNSKFPASHSWKNCVIGLLILVSQDLLRFYTRITGTTEYHNVNL